MNARINNIAVILYLMTEIFNFATVNIHMMTVSMYFMTVTNHLIYERH
jgi:hypothetical protein